MTDLRTELATLIASRICHDLISPVGAISNGLEMASLVGGMQNGPELDLITESCENANARIRFFRVAYGAANATSQMSADEVKSILSGLTKGARLTAHWDTEESMPRADVQLAFLGFQCMETAMRRGGHVAIVPHGTHITLTAERFHMPDINLDPTLWRTLESHAVGGSLVGQSSNIAPAHVQFLLLPLLAADRERRIQLRQTDTMLALTV